MQTTNRSIHRSRIALSLALLGLLSAGCGGKSSQPLTPKSFCTAESSAARDMWHRCAGQPADLWGDGLGIDYCQDMETAVSAKRVSFDATAAAACVDKLKNADCSAMFPADDPCNKVLTGQVAVGGSCDMGMDCKAGAYCATANSCPGTCTTYAAAAGDCSAGQLCAGGTYCDGSVCQTFAAKGASCDPQNGPFCSSGLYCDGSGTCAPSVADGGACTSDAACTWNEACYGGKCAKIHGVGESCSGYSNCGYGLYCSSGQCAEMPTTSGPCGYITDGYVDCLGSGYYCHITDWNAATGTCAAQAATGATCDPHEYRPCHDGYCDSGTNTCVAACHES